MFLAGQNLDEVRGHILGRKSLPTIREAFSEVRREESRRRIMLRNIEYSVNSELESSSHVARGDDSNNSWCNHCKKSWHTRELHEKPANWKSKSQHNNRDNPTIVEENQEFPINTYSIPFSKEQLENLYKLFQSPKLSLNPSCSMVQKGNTLVIAFLGLVPISGHPWIIDREQLII
ncbi:hypothetical protein CR513_01814, partial [Mucuna pruriens]